ncbi:MAG: hypothetical protein P1U83_19660, partial [Roseovarius sp.]|nr:hypothetical protein [Roseovarius sp.]
SLGKGEVECSIHSSGTITFNELDALPGQPNERPHDASRQCPDTEMHLTLPGTGCCRAAESLLLSPCADFREAKCKSPTEIVALERHRSMLTPLAKRLDGQAEKVGDISQAHKGLKVVCWVHSAFSMVVGPPWKLQAGLDVSDGGDQMLGQAPSGARPTPPYGGKLSPASMKKARTGG